MTARKPIHWPWPARVSATTNTVLHEPAALDPQTPAITMNETPPASTQAQQPSWLKPLPFYTTARRNPAPARQEERWPAEAFWYTAAFIGCVSLGLMLWGAYSAWPRAANPEKLLRAERNVPKLKGEMRTETAALQAAPAEPLTSAEPPLLPPPPAPVDVPQPKLEPVPIDLPRIDVPATAVPAQAVVPVFPALDDPLAFVSRANLGDTPMLRTWKTLALYSLMMAAPLAAPAPVAAQDEKNQKRIEEMLKLMGDAIVAINNASQGMADIRKDVDNLKAAAVRLRTDLDGLDQLLKNVRADVAFVQKKVNDGAQANGTADRAGLEELRRHLVSIEQAILKLRTPVPEQLPGRVSLSPPAPTGKVILTNMYHEEMLFVINQKAHRVLPGGVLPLDVPAGTLRYEVISPSFGLVRAPSSANLPANETFMVTAR